jgi:hypothetical protein
LRKCWLHHNPLTSLALYSFDGLGPDAFKLPVKPWILEACLPQPRPDSLPASLMRPIVFAFLFCLLCRPLFAGDAVAIGYNSDGAWSSVTYNRSSTPKGGPHYRDSAQACTFALRDLWVRSSEYLARAEILGQSDKTGYVAVAHGKALARNKDVTAVGRGNSQNEADRNALKKLNDREATTDEQIVYRYFSYGMDSGSSSRTHRNTSRANKSAAASQSNRRKT